MYGDKMTDSMQKTITETNRRRKKQEDYNIKHNITPTPIIKSTESILGQTAVANSKKEDARAYVENENLSLAADPVMKYMSRDEIKKSISKAEKEMKAAVKELNFIEAARIRDEMFALKEMLDKFAK